MQNCYFQLTACRDVVVVTAAAAAAAAVVEVKALPVKIFYVQKFWSQLEILLCSEKSILFIFCRKTCDLPRQRLIRIRYMLGHIQLLQSSLFTSNKSILDLYKLILTY